MQTRVVTCFPAKASGGNGYAIGSVEGRVAIQSVHTYGLSFWILADLRFDLADTPRTRTVGRTFRSGVIEENL
jgi:hypothetical protein